MRSTAWMIGLALPLFAVAYLFADEKSGINEEGFVQKWLVLLPIPSGESGSDALDKEFLKEEGKLQPKAEEKVKVGDTEFTWKEQTIKEAMLDFNAIAGKETEDSVAYAFTIIVAPEDMNEVRMKTGSDDQCKVFLNGKEVFKNTDARASETDQDSTEVSLKKGVNLLVVKVVNEKVDWKFCVRFTDKDDKPVAGLKAITKE